MTERSAAEQEMDLFIEAYNSVCETAPEDFKLRWAHRVVKSIRLQYTFSTTGRGREWPTRFEPASYTEDGKRPHGMGVPW